MGGRRDGGLSVRRETCKGPATAHRLIAPLFREAASERIEKSQKPQVFVRWRGESIVRASFSRAARLSGDASHKHSCSDNLSTSPGQFSHSR
jgi:hypothetical protein